MSDDRDFDPRFDAAFQRGYEGVAGAAPATRAPAARAVEPEPVAADPDGLVRRPSDLDRLDQRPDEDPAEEPRRRNPFLIVLAVLSILLVCGGLYLVVRMRDLFADTQSSTDFDFVTLQVLIGVAPIAIGLGVATAIGILFVLAVRWGRASR